MNEFWSHSSILRIAVPAQSQIFFHHHQTTNQHHHQQHHRQNYHYQSITTNITTTITTTTIIIIIIMSFQSTFTNPPRFGDLDLPQFTVNAPRGWRCCKDAQHNPMGELRCRRCDHQQCSDCLVDSIEADADFSDSESESESELTTLSHLSI
ncbi:hypothetical protein F5B19DRAFT_459232 [Rostrohypoxylon terebratum]|nr:hypothetical protein F5B19DRAFT_459232 [Rostrohypoxylon terebratum]